MTVMEAVALTDPDVAVTVADPTLIAETRPAFTVATADGELLHATLLVTFAVLLSLYVAVACNCCVLPAVMVALDGAIAIEVITLWAVVTVMAADALCPPSVAVIVAFPGATAVTTPALDTDAIVASDDAHEALVVTSLALWSL